MINIDEKIPVGPQCVNTVGFHPAVYCSNNKLNYIYPSNTLWCFYVLA
jgi:hypothetical protein